MGRRDVDRFVGIDLGTTGVRTVVVDREGALLADASLEYPLLTPRPGWAEQDPRQVVDAMLVCCRRALRAARVPRGTTVAIGLSATFHNVAPFGPDGALIGNALIWADTRAIRHSDDIKAGHDATALYARTGCPMHPMYLAPKIQWLRENGLGGPSYRSIAEYAAFRLTGVWACNLSVASGTGLLNMERRDWDEEALTIAGVTRDMLGPLVEPCTMIGRVTADVASGLGVARESVVVPGAGDGVLSSLGAGTIGVGQATVTIGTSGAVRLVAESPRTDRDGRTWCYYLSDGRWVVGAAINNGGIALRWTIENLLARRGRSYQRALAEAATVPIGSDGLFFLPFLTGERAPYWNAQARGVLFGLSIEHRPPHLVRATLEGIAYRMRSIASAVDQVGGPIRECRATGGYTRADFWLQLIANVLGRRLSVPSIQEASALGAAELAMIGVGALPDLDAAARFVRVERSVDPEPAAAKTYDRLFAQYMDLYFASALQFTRVADLRRELARDAAVADRT